MSEALIKARSGEYDLELVRFLSLERVGLTGLGCLPQCVNLVELSLANNQLSDVENIGKLTRLERLDLSFNLIRKIDPLEGLSCLRYLDLRSNRIESLEDIKCLINIPSLQVLFMQASSGEERNPVCASPVYRNQLFSILPQLSILDGAHVILISASEELETQIDNLRPDLSSYPKVELSHWFSESTLHVEPLACDNGRVLYSSLPPAFLKLEDSLEEVEESLPRLCRREIEQADIRLREMQNKFQD